MIKCYVLLMSKAIAMYNLNWMEWIRRSWSSMSLCPILVLDGDRGGAVGTKNF